MICYQSTSLFWSFQFPSTLEKEVLTLHRLPTSMSKHFFIFGKLSRDFHLASRYLSLKSMSGSEDGLDRSEMADPKVGFDDDEHDDDGDDDIVCFLAR